KPNGQWGVGILISALTPAEVLALVGQPKEASDDEVTVLAAYVYFYDLRGGAVETSIKEDKQGLGITKRNKKRFAPQQVLVQLNALAHNVLIWARRWLAEAAPRLAKLGIQRLGGDTLAVAGAVEVDAVGSVGSILVNEADRLAHRLLGALQSRFPSGHVAIYLGQT